jgi:hypothetical protein
MEVSGELHVPAAEIDPDTHWIRGWVGPTSGLDAVEKTKFLLLPGIEHRLSNQQTVNILSYHNYRL